MQALLNSYYKHFYQKYLDFKIILLAIILLSFIPASLLVAWRIRAETGTNTIALLMDAKAIQEQANLGERSPPSLAGC